MTIDAARGFAMLLVCISHFGITYFEPVGALAYAFTSRYLGLPASAIFIMLSGLTIGFLRERSGARFVDQRVNCIDRGLFLLLPAHALILAAHHWVSESIGPGTHWVFITDAIGVCLVLGPPVVACTGSRVRIAMGIGLIALSWCLYVGWSPVGQVEQIAKAVLLGQWDKGVVFPIMPWFGAFLIATTIGEGFAVQGREGRIWFLGELAAIFLLLGAGADVASHGQSGWLFQVLNARQKYPPGPGFIVCSFGLGLALLMVLEIISDHRLARRALMAAAVLGRSSLFVFILQYYVYYVAFFVLKLPMSALWPMYFLGSILVIYSAAMMWERYFGNVYLTVGLKSRGPAVARNPARIRQQAKADGSASNSAIATSMPK